MYALSNLGFALIMAAGVVFGFMLIVEAKSKNLKYRKSDRKHWRKSAGVLAGITAALLLLAVALLFLA